MTPRTLLEQKITRILALISAKDEDMISTDMTLDALGIESLDVIEICIEIEAEFGVPVSDADIMKLVTIGDVINLIERLEKQSATA